MNCITIIWTADVANEVYLPSRVKHSGNMSLSTCFEEHTNDSKIKIVIDDK